MAWMRAVLVSRAEWLHALWVRLSPIQARPDPGHLGLPLSQSLCMWCCLCSREQALPLYLSPFKSQTLTVDKSEHMNI